jgi:CheY-like chemotaxis protein
MIRALVVDDVEQNLYLLQKLLEGSGYQVESAHNGAEALELARRDPPDIAVSDILMPVMDGFSLCREWRNDPTLKDIPFVFYTATYTDPRDQKFALDLDADRFVTKPIEPEEFVKILGEVMAEYRAGRLPPRQKPVVDAALLKEYNQVLFHKLEDKMAQLDSKNRELKQYVSDQEKQIRERTSELQRVVNLMADREIRMSELKAKLRQLREQLEQAGLTPMVDDPALHEEETHREPTPII